MGQKVHPYGFRIGFNRTWHSRWYAERDKYIEHLHDDMKLRRELKDRLAHAGVSEIDVERYANKLKINVQTSRPGVIIGKRGAEVDKLRDDLQRKTKNEVHVNIIEIQRPETDAQLVAESIAMQLERRVAFRRAMKKAIESAQRFGAQGIKLRCAGRLNGAEIARSEWYQEGRLPLHTLKADIDYGFAEANTTYGKIGVKAWIYRGEQHKVKSRRREAKKTA
jgi:small subunit ribosomal protein S3